jgi:hypothetical protein
VLNSAMLLHDGWLALQLNYKTMATKSQYLQPT